MGKGRGEVGWVGQEWGELGQVLFLKFKVTEEEKVKDKNISVHPKFSTQWWYQCQEFMLSSVMVGPRDSQYSLATVASKYLFH